VLPELPPEGLPGFALLDELPEQPAPAARPPSMSNAVQRVAKYSTVFILEPEIAPAESETQAPIVA
jgi:hypothetical protein